jgi:hypothetical protein
MTDMTLHPGPRWRDVVLEQIRVVGLSLRREALVVAAVLAIGTVMVGGELVQGGPGFDSTDTFPIPLVAFLFPFAVWRSEKRFGPSFLWTLPVDRQRLALARVFAGFVWLMAAVAVFTSWLLGLALIARVPLADQLMRVPVILTIALYLFGSAIVLGLRHPLRWLIGAFGVLLLMGKLSDALTQPDDREWRGVPGAQDFFSAVSRAAEYYRTLPESVQWTLYTFLWIGAGLAALLAAAWRHRERRRR